MNPWKKEAIKITKIYDNKIKTEYKIYSKYKLKEGFEQANNNPEIYQKEIKKKDDLKYLPEFQVNKINEKLPSDEKIKVSLEFVYKYNSPNKEQNKTLKGFDQTIADNVRSSFTISLVAITAILVTIGFICSALIKHQSQQTLIDNTCFMYLKEGTPESIEIDGFKYKMKPNGELDDIDAVLLNPHHRQLLQYQECVKVNLKE